MRLRAFLAVCVFAAALPALAAPTCNAGQVVVGNNCTLSAVLGWATAGQGTDSIITIFVPPNVSGPVEIEVTGLNSSLGNAYTGYLGFMAKEVGASGSAILTLADIVAGTNDSIGTVQPGELIQFQITQVCWDPTCTRAAPAGAVPNMFSLQFLFSTPNTNDINLNDIQLAVRFISGGVVNFQEQETALRTNSLFSIIPGVSIGATPAGRYVYTGTAVNQPFDVISISNFGIPTSISGTVTLQDANGNNIVGAPLPSIPPGGAAGFLLIGIPGNSTPALFPSSTVLPAGSDGNFHGTLIVGMTGLSAAGVNIVLAQEFNGNTMLNLPVFHSPVP